MTAYGSPSLRPRTEDKGRWSGHRPSRREVWAGALLVLATCGLLAEAPLWKPGARFTKKENVQIAEAQAWWQGRLDLPERKWDTALRDGRVYNCFPPMFTILAAAWVPFVEGVPHGFMVMLAVTVPVLAYTLFYTATGSPLWGSVLGIGYACGTSAWPVLDRTLRSGMPYHVNETLASVGILLLLNDYCGRRRIWPAAIGLTLAAWSRQLTVIYMLPLASMAFYDGPMAARWKRIAMVAVTGLILAGVYCGLNTMKFGHPFVTGYMLIHEGRDDAFAQDAREHGLLSAHWIGRNLYYANLGFPNVHQITTRGKDRVYLRPNIAGTGIWWTTPMLLWLLVVAPRLMRQRSTAVLLGSAFAVYALLMLWYTTGAQQRGYNRFSLDYIPLLMALIAPYCIVGWRRWVTLAMIAWSVLYFRVLMQMPHVEVWSS